MSTSVPYPLQLEFHADRSITRWRPFVQWLLAIPHLMIAWALRSLRQVLTLISFFTVLFTKRIPRPVFDAIVMTYRYEWRAMSYAFFMHEDYPPFDFDLSSEDDGMEPHTSLRLTYPEHLERWKPLYKWFLAIPQYFVLAALFVAACVGIVVGFVRRARHRGVPGENPGLPRQRLPLRAPCRGLRRLPHRSVPAVQPRRLSGHCSPLNEATCPCQRKRSLDRRSSRTPSPTANNPITVRLRSAGGTEPLRTRSSSWPGTGIP